LSKKIIELTLIGAFLAAKGIPVQARYLYILENDEVDSLIYDFNDTKTAQKWLSEMLNLYRDQPEDRPVHFYPKNLHWENKDKREAPIESFKNHFENEDEKQYPNEYQQQAFHKSISDFNEKIHVDNVQSDWESYGKFFEILN
jgi:hypothetical protein